MLQKLQFFAVLLFVLSGCSNEPAALNLLQKITFDNYEMDDTISVPINFKSSRPLLVEVITTETSVVMQLVDSDETVINSMPKLKIRLAPIILVLDAGTQNDEFRLDIDIVARTKNSKLEVSVFELRDSSDVDQDLTSAYSQYALANSSGQGSGEENTLRIAQLDNSARLFRKVNRPEMAMWSELIAARFHLWPGNEFVIALQTAEAVSAESAALGNHEIELMSRNLEGVALTSLCGENPYANLLDARNEALNRFQMAVELAQEFEMSFEIAWALNNMGIASFYLHKPVESIAQYQRAMEVAEDIDDKWLANLIAGNLGLVREIKGGAAIKLAEIEQRKQEVLTHETKGQDDQLAHALTELGRVYLQLHLFPQAVEALSWALDLLESLNNAPDTARVNLWLANAYHSMGNFDRAESLLGMAIPELEQGGSCRPLIEAHARAASLARMKGDFKALSQNREKQYSYLATDKNMADYFMELAMDSLAGSPPDTPSALQYFEQAIAYHASVDAPTSAALLQVQYCSVAAQQGQPPLACSSKSLAQSYDYLQQHASPQARFQGMQAWAQILKLEGRSNELEQHFKSMIDLIGFYRNKLPGVLGSWYWEARSDIFNMYLELVIARDLENNTGVESLLVLDGMRNVDLKYSRSNSSLDSQDRLRSLVLDLGQLKDANEIEGTRREIELLLAQSENIPKQVQEHSETWLENEVISLPEDTSVLTYHFSNGGVYRWLIDNGGVHLKRISKDDSIMTLAGQVRGNLRIQGYSNLQSELATLGESLLGDLAESLPDKLVLISGGPLNGLPLDALMVGGDYVGSSTTVINMLSLAGLGSIRLIDEETPGYGRVFAAGATNWQQLGMPDLDWVPAELELVKSAFPLSEFTFALNQEFNQGVFNGEAIAAADLVHIASHSELNLEYPELSKFYLGDAKSEKDFLSPLALSNMQMNAKLVVLSACETSGSNVFSFDSNLGFVSSFLGNGADSVLATLWPVPDRESFGFMQQIYANLGDNMPVMEAYARAKKSRLQTPERGALSSAFAFQIYVQ